MFQLPRQSRTLLVIQPGNQWDWNEVLLNKISYFAEVLAWQNTKDAQKKSPTNQPTMFKPDFIQNERTQKLNRDKVSYTTDDIKNILSKPRSS